MSALEELRAGVTGNEFVALLSRTFRAVAVARNFPPPEGLAGWTNEAVEHVVSEFMSDPQTPRRLTDLATLCRDDGALAARLQGAARNFLADLGRRTPIGKLVLRVNDVLGHHPDEFVREGFRWGLASGSSVPGPVDLDLLGNSIRAQVIPVPKWGHEASRSAPVADARSIVSMCRSLLEAAGGPLTTRTLAQAIGMRLGVGQAPLSLDAPSLDGGTFAQTSGDITAAEALRPMRSDEILQLFNDRERLSIAWHEYSIREIAPLLGVSSSQAHLIRRRAFEILRMELMDDDDSEGTVAAVVDLAQAWAKEWTEGGGST